MTPSTQRRFGKPKTTRPITLSAPSGEDSVLAIGDRLVTTKAPLQNILPRKPEQMRVIFELPQGDVAVIAEKAPQLPRRMAVIKGQSSGSVVSAADVAMGMRGDDNRLLESQSILAHRLLDVTAKRVASVSTAIILAALGRMLCSVLANARIFTKVTARLSLLFRDIVPAEKVDRPLNVATIAGLSFHSTPIAESRESVECGGAQ